MTELTLKLEGTPIQAPNGVPTGGLNKLVEIVQLSIELVFIFAILLCLYVLIFSGFQWVFSGGDKQKLQTARQRITYAVVGLSLVFLSLLIMSVLSKVAGVNLLDIPTP